MGQAAPISWSHSAFRAILADHSAPARSALWLAGVLFLNLAALAGKSEISRLLPLPMLDVASFRVVFLGIAILLALLFHVRGRGIGRRRWLATVAIGGPLLLMLAFNLIGQTLFWANAAWHENDTDLVVMILMVGATAAFIGTRKQLIALCVTFCVVALLIDCVDLITRRMDAPVFTSITGSRINTAAFFVSLFLVLVSENSRRQIAAFLGAELFLLFAVISGAKIGIVVLAVVTLLLVAYMIIVGRYRLALVVALTFLLPLPAVFLSSVATEIKGRFSNAFQIEVDFAEGKECIAKDNYAIVHSKKVCLSFNDTTERVRLWAHAVKLFVSAPIIGSGPDTYSIAITIEYSSNLIFEEITYIYSYPHNIFLQSLVDGGVISFSIFSLSLFACAVVFGRATHQNAAYGALFAVLAAMLLAGMFGGNLYDVRYIWLFAAAVAAANTSRDTQVVTHQTATKD